MTTSMWAALILGLLLAVLAPNVFWWYKRRSTFIPPGAHDAIAVMMRIYSMHHPPRITWIRTPTGTFRDSWGRKVAGLAHHENAITVAIKPWQKFSQTALAHEIGHVYLLRLTGNPDPNHEDPIWHPGGIVAAANRALERHEAGLESGLL